MKQLDLKLAKQSARQSARQLETQSACNCTLYVGKSNYYYDCEQFFFLSFIQIPVFDNNASAVSNSFI